MTTTESSKARLEKRPVLCGLESRFQFDQQRGFDGEPVSQLALQSPVGAGDFSSSDACSRVSMLIAPPTVGPTSRMGEVAETQLEQIGIERVCELHDFAAPERWKYAEKSSLLPLEG
jgi:hypothetical protein